jgi:chromosome segregation ATPase
MGPKTDLFLQTLDHHLERIDELEGVNASLKKNVEYLTISRKNFIDEADIYRNSMESLRKEKDQAINDHDVVLNLLKLRDQQLERQQDEYLKLQDENDALKTRIEDLTTALDEWKKHHNNLSSDFSNYITKYWDVKWKWDALKFFNLLLVGCGIGYGIIELIVHMRFIWQ